MADTLRAAVVGVGAMGRNHARIWQSLPDVDLVALVDPNAAAAERVSRLHGGRVYADVAAMVADVRPDLVSVAVPTQDHFEIVSALLTAGCHVLVEKPIAATLDEASALVALAEAQGRVLMVGHVERFNPAITELKRRLDGGEAGRVFQIRARRMGPFPARIRDVGVVIDLATHDLDIMRYLTGSEAVRVYAEARREVHTACEDMLSGMVRFKDDTLGVLEINWLTPTKIRELCVTGERGMFQVDYITQDLFFFENAEARPAAASLRTEWHELSVLRGVSEGAMTRFAFQKVEPLRAELEAFVAGVRGDSSGVVHGLDGRAALQLAMALAESAQQRQVITL